MSIWALAETARLRGRSSDAAPILLFKSEERAERRVEVRKVELMLQAILDADDDIVWRVVGGGGEGDAKALREAKEKAATLPKAAFLPHWDEFNGRREYSFDVSRAEFEDEGEDEVEAGKKRKLEAAAPESWQEMLAGQQEKYKDYLVASSDPPRETWEDHCRKGMRAQVVCRECGGGVAGECACARERWLRAQERDEFAFERAGSPDVMDDALRRQGL